MNDDKDKPLRATDVRQSLINSLPDVVKKACGLATCPSICTINADQKDLIKQVWPTVHALVMSVDDPLPIQKISSGEISGRVDAVLQQVAEGHIDTSTAKKYIELLQAGFELTTLPDMLAKLEAAGLIK
jgi:hypothetical protein